MNYLNLLVCIKDGMIMSNENFQVTFLTNDETITNDAGEL